ncbi:hypothetical protein V6N11_022196 [Hibiscus sabdariffa]|uniref:Uncharacterized protein n=1 Tax=Hibiscus sabdariffa TaxID=183260 RepID=A0ABR2TIT2_9ROSI
MVTDTGDWDWSKLNLMLSAHVISLIAVVPSPNMLLGRDLLGWRWKHDRHFSTKSTYASIVHEKSRCSLLFDANFLEDSDLISVSQQLSATYVVAFSSSRISVGVRRTGDLMWQCPPKWWVKANSDGAMHPSSDKAVARGVLRDDRESWNFGFSRSLGCCSVLIAE